MFKKNLEYGSEEGNKAIEKFTELFKQYAIANSMTLEIVATNGVSRIELVSKEKS